MRWGRINGWNTVNFLVNNSSNQSRFTVTGLQSSKVVTTTAWTVASIWTFTGAQSSHTAYLYAGIIGSSGGYWGMSVGLSVGDATTLKVWGIQYTGSDHPVSTAPVLHNNTGTQHFSIVQQNGSTITAQLDRNAAASAASTTMNATGLTQAVLIGEADTSATYFQGQHLEDLAFNTAVSVPVLTAYLECRSGL